MSKPLTRKQKSAILDYVEHDGEVTLTKDEVHSLFDELSNASREAELRVDSARLLGNAKETIEQLVISRDSFYEHMDKWKREALLQARLYTDKNNENYILREDNVLLRQCFLDILKLYQDKDINDRQFREVTELLVNRALKED